MTKNELIKGITIDDIYDFVDNGDPDDAPEEIIVYMDLMDMVRSMSNRALHYGTKSSIIKHLMKIEGLTRHIATNVYYNALEYFYVSAQLSKKAQINVYADKIDRQIAIAEPMVLSVEESNIVVNMILKAAKVRGLDKEDAPEIPKEYFQKKVILYTTDALKAGMDPINRLEVAKQVDELEDIPEKVKRLIKEEALIENLTLFPDEQENARKG